MSNSTAGFYVTCVSNACMDVYENNTQATFKNLLPEPLNLNNHEVALVEFSYTETWVNVREDFKAIIINKKCF